MGYLTIDRLEHILNHYDFKSNVFLETGTYNGRSIIPIAKKFKFNCHTIEILEELSNSTKKKAKNQNVNNITFYVGDSIKLLESIISKIEDENLIIFLDAHSSNYESNNIDTIHEDTKYRNKNNIKPDKNYVYSCDIRKTNILDHEVPLLEELKIISKFNKNILLIIDDYDLFGLNTDVADWTSINESSCLEIFNNKNMDFKIYENPSQLILNIKK